MSLVDIMQSHIDKCVHGGYCDAYFCTVHSYVQIEKETR